MGYLHPFGFPDDAVYKIKSSFLQATNAVQFSFAAMNLMAITDESWGIDNIFVNLSEVLSNSSPSYYLPEQSLAPLIGTSAFGLWQLEIQDDRVGATNHTVLDSWQLQIAFSQTNPVPAIFGWGGDQFRPARRPGLV